MIHLVAAVLCVLVLLPVQAWAIKPVKIGKVVDTNGTIVGEVIGFEEFVWPIVSS